MKRKNIIYLLLIIVVIIFHNLFIDFLHFSNDDSFKPLKEQSFTKKLDGVLISDSLNRLAAFGNKKGEYALFRTKKNEHFLLLYNLQSLDSLEIDSIIAFGTDKYQQIKINEQSVFSYGYSKLKFQRSSKVFNSEKLNVIFPLPLDFEEITDKNYISFNVSTSQMAFCDSKMFPHVMYDSGKMDSNEILIFIHNDSLFIAILSFYSDRKTYSINDFFMM